MTPRISTTVAALLCLGFFAPAFADDAHHPEKAQAAQSSPVVKPETQSIKAMQDNVAKMQGQLRRIAKAKSDKERENLVTEHMRTLHENMMMAKGMQEGMSCPMMEGMMSGKGGMGMPATEGAKSGSEERMRRMEMRMDMMEKTMKSGAAGDMAPGSAKP